jgi:hypothetical protein
MYVNFDSSTALLLLTFACALIFVGVFAGRLWERSKIAKREAKRQEKRTDRVEKKALRVATQQGKRLGRLECAMAQLAVDQRCIKAELDSRNVRAAKVIDGNDRFKVIRAKGQEVIKAVRTKGVVRVAGAAVLALLGAVAAAAGYPVPQLWRWPQA